MLEDNLCGYSAMMLFMDQTILRGNDCRGIRLHEIFVRKVDMLGPDECWTMGCMVDSGKTNKVRMRCSDVCGGCRKRLLPTSIENGDETHVLAPRMAALRNLGRFAT